MAKFNADKSFESIEITICGKEYKMEKLTQEVVAKLREGYQQLSEKIKQQIEDEDKRDEILENNIYAVNLAIVFDVDPNEFKEADIRSLKSAWEFFQEQAFGKIDSKNQDGEGQKSTE